MGTKKTTKEGTAKPVAETKTKTAPKRVAAAKPVAKPAVKAAPKKAPKTTAKTVKTVPASKSDIEVRAYYLSVERRAAGLRPDPISDWLEAERQLMA
jgi:hypothetical protein